MAISDQLNVRNLGLQPYKPIWQQMQYFTDKRDSNTIDEIWSLQHQPVFTQGQAGKAEHILNTGDIPVVQVDRGGQVTYHGPGQAIIYLLLNIKRCDKGIRELVSLMEDAIIATLANYGIQSYAKADAPGVYVEQAKIASLGLRVRKGCCFHGLALNLNMDLEPFKRINPCGYKGLVMTQLAELVEDMEPEQAQQQLLEQLIIRLKYTEIKQYQALGEL